MEYAGASPPCLFGVVPLSAAYTYVPSSARSHQLLLHLPFDLACAVAHLGLLATMSDPCRASAEFPGTGIARFLWVVRDSCQQPVHAPSFGRPYLYSLGYSNKSVLFVGGRAARCPLGMRMHRFAALRLGGRTASTLSGHTQGGAQLSKRPTPF